MTVVVFDFFEQMLAERSDFIAFATVFPETTSPSPRRSARISGGA
ncbi:hypothetical protein ACFOD8_07805 [Arthrobacter agilis]|nr:hypothetical protein [Arthrobacter agilis]